MLGATAMTSMLRATMATSSPRVTMMTSPLMTTMTTGMPRRVALPRVTAMMSPLLRAKAMMSTPRVTRMTNFNNHQPTKNTWAQQRRKRRVGVLPPLPHEQQPPTGAATVLPSPPLLLPGRVPSFLQR
jgi:hypothetical protein